jgi:hypothetical protein
MLRAARKTLLAVLGVAVLLLVPEMTHALDQGVAGRSLLIKRSRSGKEKLVVVLKDPALLFPAVGSSDDPTVAGMRVELFPGNGSLGAALVIPPGLATTNWKTKSGTGKTASYKFVNKEAPEGVSEIRAALLREGRVLKIIARGAGLALAGPQGSVGVRITSGEIRNCALFDAPSVQRDETDLFRARNATTVPADCATETIDGTVQCGDHVVDPPETCDVPLPPPGESLSCVPAGEPGECTSCGGGPFLPCCGPSVIIPSPGMIHCISTTCAPPWRCNAGDQCLPDGSCCEAALGDPCGTFIGVFRLLSCCPGTECGKGDPSGLSLACCVPESGACTADDECCSNACGSGGTCDPCLANGAACSSGGTACCSHVCGSSGTCDCLPTGSSCLADLSCCSGSCNATTGKCDP